MGKREFDDSVKRALSMLDQTGLKSDWDTFSKILHNQEDFKDARFDDMVVSKLSTQMQRFNSFHWVILKNRLETEALLRKKIFTNKLIESSLALLLLFTYLHVERYIGPPATMTQAQYAEQKLLKYPEYNGKVTENSIPTNTIILPDGYQSKDERSHIDPSALIDAKVNSDLRSAILSVKQSMPLVPFISNRLPVAELPKLLPFRAMGSPTASIDTPQIDEQAKDQKGDVKENEYVSMLPIVSVNELKYEIKNTHPMFYIIPESEKVGREYYVSLKNNYDLSIIKSPNDETFNVDKYKVITPDYSAGVAVSAIASRFELESGLMYQVISYTPKQLIEIEGGFLSEKITSTKLQKIKYKILSLPISLKYHIPSSSKHSLYTVGGVNVNGVAWSHYDIQTTNLNTSNGFSGILPEVDRNERSKSSPLTGKTFSSGLVEGGNVFDNIFMTVNAGVGVQREINNKVSADVSLTYHKTLSFTGLGPNKDLVDAVRLGIGIKYQI